jgi:ParB/RepB/Spo0J family partition protein
MAPKKLIEDEQKQELPEETAKLFISTKLIRPNPNNPRTEEDKAKDSEIADSVALRGVETEIRVRPIEPDTEGHIYEVFDGDRRLAAAIKAKIAKVPVIVEKKTDFEAIEFGLVSIIRRDLNDIEMGRAIARLLEDDELRVHYPSQRALAKKLTMSVARVNQLYLLVKNLDPWAQERVAPVDPKTKRIPDGAIDGRLGYEIAKIDDKERQREVTQEIISHPELNWNEKRLIAAEARDETETPAKELTERRLAHHEQRRPTMILSAQDYQDIKDGKKRILIEPTRRPGISENSIIDPLIKEEPLEIGDVFERPLGRFQDMDVQGAGYANLEEFKEAWTQKHGSWTDEQKAYIYLFKGPHAV